MSEELKILIIGIL